MTEAIWVAVIGGVVTILVTVMGLTEKFIALFKRKKKTDSISDISDPDELKVSFKQISAINNEIADLFAKTTADRFLILLYEDEGEDTHVTAIYEQHRILPGVINLSYGAVNRYVRIAVDDEYQNMIREIKTKGSKKYEADTMPNGLLRSFYVYENVRHSAVYFLYEFGKNVLFISIATHSETQFSQNEDTYFQLLAAKLKQIIS